MWKLSRIKASWLLPEQLWILSSGWAAQWADGSRRHAGTRGGEGADAEGEERADRPTTPWVR
jgi:hypothetical protein